VCLSLSFSLSLSLSLSTRFVREQHTTENLAKRTTATDDAWAKLCCCWCLRLFDLRFAVVDPRQVVSDDHGQAVIQAASGVAVRHHRLFLLHRFFLRFRL
jgi:hypothetical protein